MKKTVRPSIGFVGYIFLVMLLFMLFLQKPKLDVFFEIIYISLEITFVYYIFSNTFFVYFGKTKKENKKISICIDNEIKEYISKNKTIDEEELKI